jgi:hypothetical protein
MKRILFILFGLLLTIVASAQVDPGTGLKGKKDKPNTGLFGIGRQLAIQHLSPKPTGNQVIGRVGNDWGIIEVSSIVNLTSGTVVDTCNATGLVVVPTTVAVGSQIFVTPISTLGLHAAIASKSDTAFIVKFWLNDTAANLRPVVFDYLIKQN